MGRVYKFYDSGQLYFVSFSVVRWIDVFVREQYCEIIVDALKYCIKHKGLELYAWCIMPSHIHLIISSEKEKLSDIMRDLKKFTSKAIIEAIKNNMKESRREWMLWMFEREGKRNPNNKEFQFWQQDNHPIELSTFEMLEQRLNYLHNNPVMSGFVEEASYWKYSSAIDYCGGKGRIRIINALY
ncbi:MAG: transposase [Chitinophagales bacterium]|nr:transposase [Chitinophagales bacterium]